MEIASPVHWDRTESNLSPVLESENKNCVEEIIDYSEALSSNGDNKQSELNELPSVMLLPLLTSHVAQSDVLLAAIETEDKCNVNDENDTINTSSSKEFDNTVLNVSSSTIKLTPPSLPPTLTNNTIVRPEIEEAAISNRVVNNITLTEINKKTEKISVLNENTAEYEMNAKPVLKVRGRRVERRGNRTDNAEHSANKRPKRKAAPTNLTEPILKEKMRRNF